MSCVNIAPSARIWESSEDMIAAKTPAARQPARISPVFATMSWTRIGPSSGGSNCSRPAAPSTTLGNQIAATSKG